MVSKIEMGDGNGPRRFLSWLEYDQSLAHLPWYSRWRAVIELWSAAITRNEDLYARCVAELKKPAVDGATIHFASLMVEMQTDPRDVLGAIYQEASANDKKRMAQYFTPNSVAHAMAQMTLVDLRRTDFNKEGGLTICEPACGTGVMIIYALRHIFEKYGQWGLNRTAVTLIDLDLMCCRMAAIQLAWFPWPVGQIDIFQGDTLRMDGFKRVFKGGRGVPPPSTTRRIRKVG